MRGTTHSWISGLLDNRTHKIILDGSTSTYKQVTPRDPKGIVLGPVLLVLYMKDIACDLNCTIRRFADNCVMYGQRGRVVRALDFGAKVTGFNSPTLPHWYPITRYPPGFGEACKWDHHVTTMRNCENN